MSSETAIPAPEPGDDDLGLPSTDCMDCGKPYESNGCDTVLPREQWLLIHPDDGGVLCANCIAARASKLPGVINLTAWITFANDYNFGPASQGAAMRAEIDSLRQLNDELAARVAEQSALLSRKAELPSWLKVIAPHVNGTCHCTYDHVCDQIIRRAVADRLGVKAVKR